MRHGTYEYHLRVSKEMSDVSVCLSANLKTEGSSKIRSMKILQRKMDEDSGNTNEADAIT